MRGALIVITGLTTGVIALLLSLGSSGQAGAVPTAADRKADAANQRAATLDAENRLAALLPPAGATPLGEAPTDGKASLQGPPLRPGAVNLIDLAAWWETPAQPSEVLNWLEAHPPAGSRLKIKQALSERGVGLSWSVGYSWPPLRGEVDYRMLLVTITQRSGGGTALRVDSQAVWILPHPPSAQIPAAARLLEVRWERPGHGPRLTTIAAPRAVRRIAKLIDALPAIQPSGPVSCPTHVSPDGPRTLRLRFLSSRKRAPLAVATQALPPGGICGNPFKLTIRGKRQPLFAGGGKALQALKRD